VSNILDMIDGAIDDCTLPDSMRWIPEPPDVPHSPPPTAPPAYSQVANVEVVVKMTDGRVVAFEFDGEHALLDVENHLEHGRPDGDLFGFGSRRVLSAPMTAKLVITARGSGRLFRMRMLPAAEQAQPSGDEQQDGLAT
jgi:hypothetical protein